MGDIAPRRPAGWVVGHTKITLDPVNADFEPIVLSGTDEGSLQGVAEVVEVLGGEREDCRQST